MNIIPVILSGGSGTRLWPLSRQKYPKQYLPLSSDKTMLQETMLRIDALDSLVNPIIVCNSEHRFLVAQQLQEIEIKKPTILLEPVSRNTAPAIIAAALQSIKQENDAILLVLPADHVIQDIDIFHHAINVANKQAQAGKLATFGIVPIDANIGYGYIKKGKAVGKSFKVEKFVEKPNQEKADILFASGEYLWNSGMFVFKANTLLEEMSIYSPEIVDAVKKSTNNATQDLDFIRLNDEDFASSPNDSIDYALIEKTDNAVVVPLDAAWNDIGSWDALYEISSKDDNGNSITGDVITFETNNSYINANHHIVATIGVDNLIVVDTVDATLVASRDKSQEVKKIVEWLQNSNRCEYEHHRKVYRPWGWYDSIASGKYFQVKKLHIKPRAKLSLQLHNQRAEHWVVVSGEAVVTNGDNVFILMVGESTYIPIGVIHSLENKIDKPLEVIEVQSGTYLDEDDIVRFEDIYGRIEK